jgi:hypothetical protein
MSSSSMRSSAPGPTEKWPSPSSRCADALGSWDTSHLPWEKGTARSAVPCQIMVGTEISPKSKPHGLVNARSSLSHPSTPVRTVRSSPAEVRARGPLVRPLGAKWQRPASHRGTRAETRQLVRSHASQDVAHPADEHDQVRPCHHLGIPPANAGVLRNHAPRAASSTCSGPPRRATEASASGTADYPAGTLLVRDRSGCARR